MHILTPVDGSEPSFRAIELAAKLATGLNSKLTILVVRQYIVGRKVTADVLSQDDVDQLLRKSRSAAITSGMKEATVADVKSRDVAHTTHRRGPPRLSVAHAMLQG